jgi:hypothetical protein
MVNVILNLLSSALFAVMTSITPFGPEGKAIVQEIDDGEGLAMRSLAWPRMGADRWLLAGRIATDIST